MGLARLESGIKEMKRVGFSVPVIASSPYLRALGTAKTVARLLALPDPIVRSELASGVRHDSLRKVAAEYASQSPVMILGHMPEIAIFGTRITNLPRIMDQGLQPADILLIEVDEADSDWREGKLIWWRALEDWKAVKP